MRLYSSNDANEAHREGERDARYGHRNYDYDRYSDSERDRAYFEGHREEERRQERREEERREEEAEYRRQEYLRQEEAAMEEQQMLEEQERQQAEALEAQLQREEEPPEVPESGA